MPIRPADSPCQSLPWAALPVGAKAVCALALLLLRVLAWGRRDRADV